VTMTADEDVYEATSEFKAYKSVGKMKLTRNGKPFTSPKNIINH